MKRKDRARRTVGDSEEKEEERERHTEKRGEHCCWSASR